jgi:hypothetical protein
MAFSQVIYEQAPRTSTLGAAITQSAANIGGSIVEAAKIRREQNEKLVSLTLPFLPKLANNPELMAAFTSHPDFSRILGAYNNIGLSSVFKFDPSSGSYGVNLPPHIPSVEEGFVESLGQQYAPGSPEYYKALSEAYTAKNLDPYSRAVLAQRGDEAVLTQEERLQKEARERAQRESYAKALGEALTSRDIRQQASEELGETELERPYEYGGFPVLGFGRKHARTLSEVPINEREKAFPKISKRRKAIEQRLAEERARQIAYGPNA